MYFFRWTAVFFFEKWTACFKGNTCWCVFRAENTRGVREGPDRVLSTDEFWSARKSNHHRRTKGKIPLSDARIRQERLSKKKYYMHVIKTRTLSVLNRRVTRLTSETSSPCSLTD
jgi:hypothetical protein